MPCSDQQLVDMANEWSIEGKDLISEVTCREPYEWKDLTDEEWEFSKAAKARLEHDPFHVRPCVLPYAAWCGMTAAPSPGFQLSFAHAQVVAYDFGIKQNILRRLASFGCKVTVVPADYPAEKVLALKPDGVFFSNGPVSCFHHEL